MLVVPKIPHFKEGDILSSGSVNHIIKRIEYGAELLKKVEARTIRFNGSAVGYYYIGGQLNIRRPFLYRNGNFSNIERTGIPVNNLFVGGISGNLVVGQNPAYGQSYWTYKDGVFLDRYLPVGSVFQMIPNGIYGNWVVGLYRPSVFINGYGFATNIQTNEMITIVHPDTNNTNQAGAIFGNSVLGYGDNTTPNNSFRIFYIYNLGSDPNKKASYRTIAKYSGDSALGSPIYLGIGQNGILCGGIYSNAENYNAFYSTGTFNIISKANRTFIKKPDSLLAQGVSGNYLALNAFTYSGSLEPNTSISYAYNIATGLAIPVLPSYAIGSYLAGIDIG